MNLFDLLTEKQKEYFNIVSFKKDELCIEENSLCDKLGILLNGEVKITTFTTTDKLEVITVINKDNPLIGQYLLFSSNPYYLGNGIVTLNCSIAWISKNRLLKLFQENQEFLNTYMIMICQESFEIKQQVKLLAQKNIRDRIFYYLTTHKKNNIVKIKNVSSLSSILSLPRPSVSRELTKMEKDGLIKRNKNIIYII